MPDTRAALVAGFLLSVASAGAAQTACGSWTTAALGAPFELAPLAGYTEVCSQDAALCARLTAGYPPSVVTLGYFVPTDEWAAFRRGAATGFGRYLIAQLASATRPEGLPALKTRLRAQQGDIPDATRLPALLESAGRVSFGVFDESERSVSFGVVMRARPVGAPTGTAEVALASTNTALVVGDRVLSLYVFRQYAGQADVEAVQRATTEWLECLTAVR